MKLHVEMIFTSILYSHYIELLRIEDSLKRLFYETECLNGNWSVVELKRQIGSSLYERTGLSKDKEKLLELTQRGIEKQSASQVIRNPYLNFSV